MSESITRHVRADRLARLWADMPDAARQSCLERGLARVADVEVECVSAESWRADWRDDEGAAWPCYTLAVSVDGVPVGEVTGWHLVGMLGPDCSRRAAEWGEQGDDGAFRGTPRPVIDGDGRTVIEPGAHVGGDLILPLAGADGALLVYETGEYGQLRYDIESAAGDADHGDAPSLDDLDDVRRDHRASWDTAYAIRDLRVVELTVYRLERFGSGARDEHDRREYLLTGYAVEDGDVYESQEEAIESLDDAVYRPEAEAEAALAKALADALDDDTSLDSLPGAGLVGGADSGFAHAIVWTDEDGDEIARVDLDASDAADVARDGWYAVADRIVEAFAAAGVTDHPAVSAVLAWRMAMDDAIADRPESVADAPSYYHDDARRLVCQRWLSSRS